MYPVLIEIFGVSIASWHFAFSFGALSAFFYSQMTTKNSYRELHLKLDRLFFYTYVSGFFGARWFSVFLEKEYKQKDFNFLVATFDLGSMTLYGGVILGFIVGYFFVRRWGLSTKRCADLLSPAIFLGIGIGRIGCFLNGDDYGKPLESQIELPFWAVQITVLEDGIYRYPVQLFESLVCLMIFCISHFLNKRLLLREGAVSYIAFGIYCVSRFFLEDVRGDYRGENLFFNFSPAQFISLILFAYILVSSRQFITQESSTNKSPS